MSFKRVNYTKCTYKAQRPLSTSSTAIQNRTFIAEIINAGHVEVEEEEQETNMTRSFTSDVRILLCIVSSQYSNNFEVKFWKFFILSSIYAYILVSLFFANLIQFNWVSLFEKLQPNQMHRNFGDKNFR